MNPSDEETPLFKIIRGMSSDIYAAREMMFLLTCSTGMTAEAMTSTMGMEEIMVRLSAVKEEQNALWSGCGTAKPKEEVAWQAATASDTDADDKGKEAAWKADTRDEEEEGTG